MEMEFGTNGCQMLQRVVDKALNNGEWHDGFDVAVKKGDLDYYECKELFDIVKRTYPIINLEKLKSQIAHYLPQTKISSIEWLVAEDGSLIVTDSLRVARFMLDSLIWVTKRISWDGIKLIRIADGVIEGEWYDVTNSKQQWQPLRLSLNDGVLLEGQVIEF